MRPDARRNTAVFHRKSRRRYGGTQERLTFKHGASLFYEELYGGNTVWQMEDDKESLRNIYNSGLAKQGNYRPGEFAKTAYTEFNLLHMNAQSDTLKCFLGEASSDKGRGGWHFMLIMCRSLHDAAAVA